MKDRLGKEIVVGNRIVYPVRSGSCMWISEATVLNIKDNKSLLVLKPTGRKTNVFRIDNVVVVS